MAAIFIAVFAPFLSPYDPDEMFHYKMWGFPNNEHVFGLDQLGRDVLSRLIWGTQLTLFVAFTAVGIQMVIGMFVGGMAGYFTGKKAEIVNAVINIFLAIPFLLFAIVIIKALTWARADSPLVMFKIPGYRTLIVVFALGFMGWGSVARIVRSEFQKFREAPFVEAAKCLGASTRRVIFRHILPNVLPAILVIASLNVAWAIMWQAGLAYIGFGDPTISSWGFMLSMGQEELPVAWWQVVYPGFAIFLLVLGFNLLGDGINEALSPLLRE
jgi:ABC-type dipeptide/oligopeptide/nickel transport system permease subunit